MLRLSRDLTFLVLLCVVIPVAAFVEAGDVMMVEVAKLTASNAAFNDKFGNAVAIDRDTVVVAAYTAVGGASLSGAVYVFTRNEGGSNGWNEIARLDASDADVYDYFGQSVAISGDTVVVGATMGNGSTADTGAAYVFERNQGGADNWGEVKKLTASDGAYFDYFGQSVAIDGGTIVVGARYHTAAADASGAAYVFERNNGGVDNWGESTKLTASDAASNNAFGHSVAISCDTIVIGANQDKSAYVFERNDGGADNWGEVQILHGTTVGNRSFGVSVSISGSTIAVGGHSSIETGAVWLYERNFGGADNWGEVKRLTASDGTVTDFFGVVVSISGGSVLVGASRNDVAGNDAGAAYLFARNMGGADNWGEVQEIHASDAADEDYFGEAVSLDGNTVVVGAFGDDDHGEYSGSAYVFAGCGTMAGEWTEIAKTVASDGFSGHQYARDIAFNGDIAVVGARMDNDVGSSAGAAYILMRNQGGADHWGEFKKIYADDGAADDQFGERLAMSGGLVLVGVDEKDDFGESSGAVYLFARNGGGADNWGQVNMFTASDASTGARFGHAVAIDNDRFVVGAWADNEHGTWAGAAYVFERNQGGADNWGEVVKLASDDLVANDNFGYSVAVNGDTIAVGAWRETAGSAIESGAVYIFERNQGGIDNWGQVVKLKASDAATNDYFGSALDLDNDTLVVGSPGDDDAGLSSGSAYVFERNHGGADAWGQVVKLTASDAEASDLFAYNDTVSIEGDMIVIGAYGNDDIGFSSGSSYVFERNVGGADVWGETIKIVPSDHSASQNFGSAVDLKFGTIMIAAQNDAEKGSVYFFNAECPEFDFGDVPDPDYPTLLASDGARHKLGGSVFMGATVDMDLDGQPTVGADGDDTDGTDDEDGVTFTSPIVTGETAGVDVIASDTCALNAWIDFNDDGDWDDPGEEIFTDEALAAGTNSLSFTVPLDASPGEDVNARFRVSTAGSLGYTGEATDGEVEDHQVYIDEIDLGDAPDPTFPTLIASDGARHVLGGPLFLGTLVDGEIDGLPSPDGLGDDNNDIDDEDGVAFTSGLGAGLDASVEVTASGAGLLNAWVDFNADGDWADAGEQIFTDQALATGVNTLSFAVPPGATLGTSFARFRFDSAGGLSFDGLAADGEVEDHLVEIVEGPDLEIAMIGSSDPTASGRSLTFTITVTNNGPLTATSVTVTDTLQGELIFVSSMPGAPDCTYAAGALTCDLGTMAPTDTTQITLETVLDHPVYGTINNTSWVNAAELDPIPANNTATVDTLIALFADGFESGDLTAWD